MKQRKIKEHQDHRPAIFCESDTLENVFNIAYLGTIFAADGLEVFDILVRVDKAMTRCVKLSHMFDSPDHGP